MKQNTVTASRLTYAGGDNTVIIKRQCTVGLFRWCPRVGDARRTTFVGDRSGLLHQRGRQRAQSSAAFIIPARVRCIFYYKLVAAVAPAHEDRSHCLAWRIRQPLQYRAQVKLLSLEMLDTQFDPPADVPGGLQSHATSRFSLYLWTVGL